jgi:hypothetical protein
MFHTATAAMWYSLSHSLSHSHKILVLFPTLSQINLVYTSPMYFLETHFNNILPTTPRFSNWSVSFRFPYLSLFFQISLMPATCPTQFTLLIWHSNNIWHWEQKTLWHITFSSFLSHLPCSYQYLREHRCLKHLHPVVHCLRLLQFNEYNSTNFKQIQRLIDYLLPTNALNVNLT